MTRNIMAIWAVAALAVVASPVLGSPALAQVQRIDPNTAAAQQDVTPPPGERGTAVTPPTDPLPPPPAPTTSSTNSEAPDPSGVAPPPPGASTLGNRATPTYRKDDLIGAGENVFGKGAAGLAGIIERILADQGEPNAYIAGREASGAFVVGLRYGSGTLSHKVEGERPVYWTGPSVGFDVGGDAAKVFTLVYNLYDSQDLYKRYAAAEGRAYFVGGFSATYMRRGNVVLIPVRLGVGVRLGANIGWLKFSEKSRWVPF